MNQTLVTRWFAIVLLIPVAFALGSCSRSLQITLFNNTPVDLVVWTVLNETSVVAEPGGSVEFILQPVQHIDFGQMAHVYEANGLDVSGNTVGFLKNRIKVQAESDERIYLISPASTGPVSSLPSQPKGFPLAPVKVVDLT